jgi:hypothetical protein
MTVKVVLDVRYDRFKSSSSSAISLSKYAGHAVSFPNAYFERDIADEDDDLNLSYLTSSTTLTRYQAVHGTAKNRGQGLLVLGGTSNRFC